MCMPVRMYICVCVCVLPLSSLWMLEKESSLRAFCIAAGYALNGILIQIHLAISSHTCIYIHIYLYRILYIVQLLYCTTHCWEYAYAVGMRGRRS